jgi:hypothetical protein
LLIDSSKEVAILVQNMLEENNLLSCQKECGTTKVYLSDNHPDLSKWTKELLGKEIVAKVVDIEQDGLSL